MAELSPRESVIAQYLRSPDTLDSAQTFLASAAREAASGGVDVMGHLTKIEAGKDVLADMQKMTCLERLLQYTELHEQFRPLVRSLFFERAGSSSTTEYMEGPLELFLKLTGSARASLLTSELLAPKAWSWLMRGSSIKVAQLMTALLCAEGVWDRIPVNDIGAQIFSKTYSAPPQEDVDMSSPELSLGLVEGQDGEDKENEDVIWFRFLQLAADLARTRNVAIPGGLEAVAAAYFTEDILLKLNAVEFWNQLGESAVGRAFLLTNGLPDRIAAELADDATLSLDDRVAPTCVLYLAFIVAQNEDKLLVEQQATGGAPSTTTTTGAAAGSTTTMKQSSSMLKRYFHPVLKPWVERFLEAPASAGEVPKLVALRVFGQLAASVADETFFEQELQTSFAPLWRLAAQDALLGTNMERCKLALVQWIAIASRFPSRARHVLEPLVSHVLPEKTDLRPFAYQLLARMSRDSNLALQLLQAESVRALLLDFGSETTHDARMEKHGFVRALLGRPDGNAQEALQHDQDVASRVLDEKAYATLAEYADKGPYAATILKQAKVQVGKETA
ncbi:unnamed protein product [Amoebophrya sp. A25]|nr:unnamed protein product [Amoebophrya sp. A25]|eukprot:GSA25T00010742001.1